MAVWGNDCNKVHSTKLQHMSGCGPVCSQCHHNEWLTWLVISFCFQIRTRPDLNEGQSVQSELLFFVSFLHICCNCDSETVYFYFATFSVCVSLRHNLSLFPITHVFHIVNITISHSFECKWFPFRQLKTWQPLITMACECSVICIETKSIKHVWYRSLYRFDWASIKILTILYSVDQHTNIVGTC